MADYTLFVFGNGFDLAHGLPTTYNDFFYFLEALRVYARGSIYELRGNKRIAENLRAEVLDYLLAALATTPHAKYLDTIMDVLGFYNGAYSNPWHTYFTNRLELRLPRITWIDFEKEIANLIGLLGVDQTDRPYIPYVSARMKAQQESFSEELRTLSRTLYEMPKDTQRYNDIKEELEGELAIFLYQELLRYAFCFELYLHFYVSDHYMDKPPQSFFTTRFPQALEVLRNRNKSTHDPEKSKAFVLSFNYTETCEFIYGVDDWNIHHIHGVIRSKCDLEAFMNDKEFQLSTPLVLGVHNHNKNAGSSTSPYQWFEKYFQRILHKTGVAIYSWLDAVSADNHNRLEVIIYGHSLDVTDSDFIQRIFSAAHSVQIYYSGEENLPKLLTNLIAILGKERVEKGHNNGAIVFTPIP